nr:immunoglobulin light chain junction region [Macaca mulatta]MOV78475.1 immunoglobulin light chain junction region [Macaca mulatta]MOV78856.1 immunoglobulin light chain junction region [Macaca mulatta]MOV80205.1 immunoglobulin light chain junction region [Macaca mulatta]MOV81581.1 immunoglobulin light chain junction region [Macaca mulatta]
CLQGDSTPFTF